MTQFFQSFKNALSPFYGGEKRRRVATDIEGNSDGNLLLDDGDQTMEDFDKADEKLGESDKSDEGEVDDPAMELLGNVEEVGESDKSEKEKVDQTGSGKGGPPPGLVDSESDDEWVDVEGADEENNETGKREDERTGRLRVRGVDYRRLGEKLADILEERERARKRQAEEESKLKDNWLTGDIMVVCRPCSLYSQSPDVPSQMRASSRGGFGTGTIMRKNKKGRFRAKWDLKDKCNQHENTNLHIWCAVQEKKESEKKASFEERNAEAGRSAILCALKNLKRGGSSADFLGDLNLLSLTPGVVYAVKNNSSTAYYDLRDLAYECVSEKFQTFFTDIEDLAVSLDKVTVYHTSYTVVITYFFWEGRLHVVLNQLTKLKEEDYDAVGTAEMVINTLCLSLGYTRTKLAQRLRHFIYDGVYASPEERVSGGGCLSLVDTVTEALGLTKGDISGVWDMSHNLQVALFFESLNSLMYFSWSSNMVSVATRIWKRL